MIAFYSFTSPSAYVTVEFLQINNYIYIYIYISSKHINSTILNICISIATIPVVSFTDTYTHLCNYNKFTDIAQIQKSKTTIFRANLLASVMREGTDTATLQACGTGKGKGKEQVWQPEGREEMEQPLPEC